MEYTELFKYLIATSSITVGMVWIVKKMITEIIKRDNYKFSKLHDEQCLFIKKLYSDIYLLKTKYEELYYNSHDDCKKYTDFRDQHLSEFIELFNSSSLFYNSNKITN
jgi:hypothetical protein